MSKEITTAVSIGILGLGLTYIGYKILNKGSSISKPSFSLKKQKVKPVTLQRRDKRTDKVCKGTSDKIHLAEIQCFKGVNNALCLGVNDVQKITRSLVAKWMVSEEDTSDLVTLTDVLTKLRNNHILAPLNYLEVVTAVLQDVGLGLNKKAEDLLQRLRDTVTDHIEADIHDQSKKAWESDSKKIDIYVLYCEDDFEKAEKFQQDIYQHVNTRDVKVFLMDEVGIGMTILKAFEKGLKSSIYTFVLMTEDFCKDKVKIFLAGNGLIENLRTSDELWRFVPVWVDPGINESRKCPLELSVLQGLHYNRFLENEQHTRCFEQIERLLKIGRKREMEEGMKREVEERD